MENNEKVALFDFCETLVDFQTADEFVKFVVMKNGVNVRVKFIQLLYKILNKLKIFSIIFKICPTWMAGKRLLLLQLSGMPETLLDHYAEEYYNEKLAPHFILPVHEELCKLQKEGYRIVIVSAGYDVYLRYFCKIHNIQDLVCTKISFSHSKCNGIIDGLDCLLDNKIKLLEAHIGKCNNREQWCAFSDSITDLPLLKYVGFAYGVKRYSENKSWIRNNNFNLIEY